MKHVKHLGVFWGFFKNLKKTVHGGFWVVFPFGKHELLIWWLLGVFS